MFNALFAFVRSVRALLVGLYGVPRVGGMFSSLVLDPAVGFKGSGEG